MIWSCAEALLEVIREALKEICDSQLGISKEKPKRWWHPHDQYRHAVHIVLLLTPTSGHLSPLPLLSYDASLTTMYTGTLHIQSATCQLSSVWEIIWLCVQWVKTFDISLFFCKWLLSFLPCWQHILQQWTESHLTCTCNTISSDLQHNIIGSVTLVSFPGPYPASVTCSMHG